MPKRTSIYALNKADHKAIIYTDANGRQIRLEESDFETEEVFEQWKAWSDEDYCREESGDHRERVHTTHVDEERMPGGTDISPEETWERKVRRTELRRQTKRVLVCMREQLTEQQYRRLWKHTVMGRTVYRIAAEEKVTHQAVTKSILIGKKRILKKLLKK